MYKIGIIGERDSVLGYMAIGFAVHEAADAAAAGRILRRLAEDDSYAIIFIVENYAAELEAEIAAYRDVARQSRLDRLRDGCPQNSRGACGRCGHSLQGERVRATPHGDGGAMRRALPPAAAGIQGVAESA